MKAVRAKLSKIIRAPLKIVARPAKAIGKRVKQRTDKFSFLDSLRSKEIRKKLLFTISIILIYRVLAAVPLPGIDVKLFTQIFGSNPLTNIFTLVTGGRLDSPSLVAIGVGAYINASIIIQLLQTVIPKFEELSKEGERGRNVLNQYTRILAVPLSVIQAIVIYTILRNIGSRAPELSGIVANITPLQVITMVTALSAGSIVLMWLGELITEYGIGNGISVIIMVSIITSLPSLVATDFASIKLKEDFGLLLNGNLNVLVNQNFTLVYGIIIGAFLLILGIVYLTEATRKLTIQYARRFRGAGVQNSYLPLKVNQAGVIPVIFASALLTFPQIISQLLVSSADTTSFLYKVGTHLSESFIGKSLSTQTGQDTLYYYITYFVLIIAFTFFYTFVTYKPSETADNLKKSGGFIPGLRPGKATEDYIVHVLLRLTFVGAIFLAIVALIPNLVRLSEAGRRLSIFSGIGGTSLLIIVGVILDTLRQMKSLTVTKSYDQYR
jgi:preprotein translocase subunit SecY